MSSWLWTVFAWTGIITWTLVVIVLGAIVGDQIEWAIERNRRARTALRVVRRRGHR